MFFNMKTSQKELGLETTLLHSSKTDDSVHDFTPKKFDEYHGQEILKSRLNVYIKAAQSRDDVIDHILLFGPPGLGKTTLAQVTAHEAKANLRITSGPILKKIGDLVAILSNLKRGDILFIDEIHRMPISVEETLYSAMEQFKVDVIIGEGVAAKTITIPLKQFTLIGATTKASLLSAPLRSRFGITEKFDLYNTKALSSILCQSANFFSLNLEQSAALKIASCSRGTPRIAKKLLRRIRDYAHVHETGKILSEEVVNKALGFFGVVENGLTHVDISILKTLYNRPNMSAIGLDALAAIIGEDAETIEDVYEPFLIHQEYIERTPRGRTLNASAIFKIQKILNLA